MATKHHVLRLTDLEARSLLRAAGNVIEDAYAFDAVFDTPAKQRAALRAYAKLQVAIFEECDPDWKQVVDVFIDSIGKPSKKKDEY